MLNNKRNIREDQLPTKSPSELQDNSNAEEKLVKKISQKSAPRITTNLKYTNMLLEGGCVISNQTGWAFKILISSLVVASP